MANGLHMHVLALVVGLLPACKEGEEKAETAETTEVDEPSTVAAGEQPDGSSGNPTYEVPGGDGVDGGGDAATDDGEKPSKPKRFKPAATPMDVDTLPDFPFTGAGAEFDFRDAVALVKVKDGSGSETSYRKVLSDGSLAPVSVGTIEVRTVLRSSLGRLALSDGSSDIWLIDSDGTEVKVPSLSLWNSMFTDTGSLVAFKQSDGLPVLIHNGSSAQVATTTYPYSNVWLRGATGDAFSVEVMSGGTHAWFAWVDGRRMSLKRCNYGLITAVGSSALIVDDCGTGNFAKREGTSFPRSSVDVKANGGGFWHPTGAVLIGSGQSALSELDCTADRMGAVFLTEDRKVRPLGCLPINIHEMHNYPSSPVIRNRDFFIAKSDEETWVYDINSWSQRLLTETRVIKASLARRTLYYTGVAADETYVAGAIDIITKTVTPLLPGEIITDIVALR